LWYCISPWFNNFFLLQIIKFEIEKEIRRWKEDPKASSHYVFYYYTKPNMWFPRLTKTISKPHSYVMYCQLQMLCKWGFLFLCYETNDENITILSNLPIIFQIAFNACVSDEVNHFTMSNIYTQVIINCLGIDTTLNIFESWYLV